MATADETEICEGETVTLTGSGAGAGGTYAWDGGVTDGVAFTPGLGTTTYTVTGTDANGCTNTATVDITVNPLPVIDAGADVTLCLGDELTLTASGADTYVWDGGITDGVAFTPGLGTTTYTVTGTDANGCENTATVDVTVNPLPTVIATTDETEICEGETVTLTGSGAGAGGTYTWDGGITDGVAFTPGLGTTTYTVTGTDANGCENTATVDVTVNPLPTVIATADETEVCEGETVTLTASGANTYVWDGGVTDGVAFTPGLGTTTYTVTGTDANGCTNTATVDLTVNPLPTVIAIADETEICEGETVTLTGGGADSYVWDGGVTDGVAFTPELGTTTYTVTGTDANGCENTTTVDVTVNPLPVIDAGADVILCLGDALTLTASGADTYVWDGGVTDGLAFTPDLGTTTYTVIATDANGCENTATVDVTVNPLPVIDAGADLEICEGETVTLTGSGADTYTWDGGVTDGVAFTPGLGTTTYTVTGTDANGCENTAIVDITVNPLPLVDAGADVTLCLGDELTLTASGADTYVWDGGVTDGIAFTPGAGITTYTVTGTDVNGCTSTDDVIVSVTIFPPIDAGVDQEVCEGETVTLTGSGAGAGGTYLWDGGVTDGLAFTPGTGTTTYTVTGTTASGCENTATVDITVNSLPTVIATADETEICEGETVTLTASGADTYAWDSGVTDGVAFTPGLGTTTYTVTGTDANGCENTATIDVTVHDLPSVSFSADYLQGCSPFEVKFTTSQPGIAFEWNFGDGGFGIGSDVSHWYDEPGLYDVTLTITSDEECSNSEAYEKYITILNPPVASFTYSPTDITLADTRVEFINQSMYADFYVWNFGDGSPYSNLEHPQNEFPTHGAGAYLVSLIAENHSGCSDTIQQLIKIEDPLVYYIPNAFTPDGSNHNQEFKPIFSSGIDIYNYHLIIFNRWGEILFESYDPAYGWKGTYGDMGLVEDGVYLWQMVFRETTTGNKKIVNGHVSLLK
jgi:gliding motility-associated-like protein